MWGVGEKERRERGEKKIGKERDKEGNVGGGEKEREKEKRKKECEREVGRGEEGIEIDRYR